MLETFNHYSNDENVTLFSFDGNSNDAFYAINTKETIIVSASAHDGDPFEVAERQYTAVERLKKINALYLSSLENMGVDGSLEDVTYTYPHARNAYVIEKDPEALTKSSLLPTIKILMETCKVEWICMEDLLRTTWIILFL